MWRQSTRDRMAAVVISTCGCAVTAVACAVGAVGAAAAATTATTATAQPTADPEAMIPWFVITGLAATLNPFMAIDDAYSAAIVAGAVLWGVIGTHSMQQQRDKTLGPGLERAFMVWAWEVATAFLGAVAAFAAAACARKRCRRCARRGGYGTEVVGSSGVSNV
jgi:uncharacterized membrane protein